MSNVVKFPKRKMKISTDKNQIICGDCLDWLKYVPDESVTLAYLDPPFFSNSNYEIVWGNGYELRSFGDRWKGGVQHYIAWMSERVKEIHRVLKPTGSIFLHCDWHASHRLRIMLDNIFGEKNFVNEIIWHYYNVACSSKKFFSKNHDVIFWYSKSQKKQIFNIDEVRVPYAKGSSWAKKGDWGKYKTNPKGKKMTDVWDMPTINNMAKERIGYKTQKPEALLERIIKCASNKGDVCLDAFGGGGTTAAVASKLGRKFITGDVSPVAVRVIAKRLNDLSGKVDFEIRNVPKTKEEWLQMDGHEFADRICEFMGWTPNPKKSNDKGIDAYAPNDVPIQIKNKTSKIGRPDLQTFVGALSSFERGLFVAWGFAPSAYEYIQEVRANFGKEIDFIEVGEILHDILIDDKKKTEIESLLAERVKSA